MAARWTGDEQYPTHPASDPHPWRHVIAAFALAIVLVALVELLSAVSL